MVSTVQPAMRRDAAAGRRGRAATTAQSAEAGDARGWSEEGELLRYLPLIKIIAHRLAGRLPRQIDTEDLIHAGVLGLIDAFAKYEPSKKASFKSYAEIRIKGAMLDELRGYDWVSRTGRQKIRRVETALRTLEQRLGRHPSDAELKQELGVGADELAQLLMELRGVALISLDEISGRGDAEGLGALLDRIEDPNGVDARESAGLRQLRRTVTEVIDRLGEKERLVVSLYYYEDLTMGEIGEILGVSESRVSQIHTKAILALRGRLAKAVAAA